MMEEIEKSEMEGKHITDEKEGNEIGDSEYEGKLWVDMYRPSNFMDLISDECINREVLKWLKSWDGVVFGKGGLNKAPPEKKVLLMSGGPGLGKTTLAHIAARHCGYEAVEV